MHHTRLLDLSKSFILMKRVAFILLFISSYVSYSQSPWVHEKGKGYAHLKGSMTPQYTSAFGDKKGSSTPLNATIKERDVQVYGEIGLGHKFQVSTSVPYRFLSSDVNSDSTNLRSSGKINGIGNIEVSLKRNFINKAVLLSGEVKVSTPRLKSSNALGLRTGYNTWAFSPILSLGHGQEKSYFYVYSGVELNSSEISNSALFGGEFGLNLSKKFTLSGSLNIKESFRNHQTITNSSFEENFSFVNNQEYAGVTVKAHYQVGTHLGINASAYIVNINGTNIAASAPISLGAHLKW